MAKYSSAGTLVWAQRFGSTESDWANGVSADASGNVWLTGILRGAMTLGSSPQTDLTLFGSGITEAFVAQLDASGNPLRAWKIGGLASGFTLASGNAIVAGVTAHVAGSFNGTVTFDGVAGLTLTSSGNASDVFLAEYDDFSPADVALAMTADKPAPPEGDSVTFTVTLSNHGPSAAVQLRVNSLVPHGLNYVTVTPSQGTYTANTGNWEVGTLSNGLSVTLTISGTTGQSSPITARAQITHNDRADPNVANNSASATTNPTLPPGSSLVVTHTGNSGVGSLRNAMEFANANPNSGGPDVISFAIPANDSNRDANGVCTIRLLYPITPATAPVIIDGLTQSGANGSTWPPALKIALTITNTVRGASGLHLSGGNSTVRGLVIHGFQGTFDAFTLQQIGGAGIYLDGPGGNIVTGNFLGTDVTGTLGGSARENEFGVRIVDSPNNAIGGTTPALRNLLSNNDEAGVRIEGTNATNNVVLGNFIGTTVTGLAALENGVGIEIIDAPRNIIGTTNRSAGVCDNGCNLISGNDDEGILVDGLLAVGQRIVGNFIGVGLFGTNAVPNEDYGVVLDDAGFHVIGGASDPGVSSKAGNLISGNQYGGIQFDGSDGGTNIV